MSSGIVKLSEAEPQRAYRASIWDITHYFLLSRNLRRDRQGIQKLQIFETSYQHLIRRSVTAYNVRRSSPHHRVAVRQSA